MKEFKIAIEKSTIENNSYLKNIRNKQQKVIKIFADVFPFFKVDKNSSTLDVKYGQNGHGEAKEKNVN